MSNESTNTSGNGGARSAEGCHPHEHLVRSTYEAMARGDGAAIAKILGPETTWHILGAGTLAGVYRGPNEIFEFWKLVAAQTGGGLELQVDDVLANDERAVALITVTGTRGVKVLNERQIVVFELTDGVVTSARFVYERPEAYDHFWTGEE